MTCVQSCDSFLVSEKCCISMHDHFSRHVCNWVLPFSRTFLYACKAYSNEWQDNKSCLVADHFYGPLISNESGLGEKEMFVLIKPPVRLVAAAGMETQRVIEWYDWLLFLSGGKLYATSDLVFFVNWTLKLLNAAAYLMMMFADSFAPNVFDYGEESLVQWLSDKANALLALSFSITLTYLGPQVTHLLDECLSAVDDIGRSRIRTTASLLSLICFVTIIATAVSGMVLDANAVSADTTDRALQLTVGAVLTGFISVNSWFNNAMILYVIFILSLVHREQSALKRMAVSLKTPARVEKTVVQQMLFQRKRMQFLVSEVNRLVGFCPLFMFGFMFLLTPSFIMDLKQNNKNSVAIVMEILFLLLSFAAIICLLAVVHRFFVRVDELSQDAIQQLYSVQDYDARCQDLVRELSVSNINLTAWSLFDVRANTFLSFFSAIITFTVLFNQLDIQSLKSGNSLSVINETATAASA